MEVTVIRGGLLTTVQDAGRRGHRAAGVPLSGPMDPFALRVANLLVGNPEGAAALEITLIGPELEFSADALIAVCGGECDAVPAWRPVEVAAGERLKCGAVAKGCRAYLAIRGDIDVEPVLGSRSTYLRAGFGGFQGRALREGDRIGVKYPTADQALAVGLTGWSRRSPATTDGRAPDRRSGLQGGRYFVSPSIRPGYSRSPVVRVIPGAQAGEFGSALFEAGFKVRSQSDRMGIRLSGPGLARSATGDLVSTAVAPGTIQVPPDGQPIVLMADAQTIGGYPQAAHVIGVDLPLVAQLKPGDSLRFREVGLKDAQKLYLERERDLAMLRQGLDAKRASG
jgi:antagonist of KipI